MWALWRRKGMWWLLLCGLLSCAAIHADQDDSSLPELFEQLRQADTALDAQSLESQIWQRWLHAPSARANELMAGIVFLMDRGDLPEALALNNMLIDEHDDYAEAWNKRATIYYLMGDNDRSVADISRTLAREPRHFGAISGLGQIFLRKGDLQGALDAFEQVLNISPQSASAQRVTEQLRIELDRKD